MMTLDSGQKHILKLIARDRDGEGWAKVSPQIFPFLEKEFVPRELVELQRTSESGGGGRVRLTPTGENVVEAMAWL